MNAGWGETVLQNTTLARPLHVLCRQRATHLAPYSELVTLRAPDRRGSVERTLLPPAPSLATKRGCLDELLHPKGVHCVRCDRAMWPSVLDRSAGALCEGGCNSSSGWGA